MLVALDSTQWSWEWEIERSLREVINPPKIRTMYLVAAPHDLVENVRRVIAGERDPIEDLRALVAEFKGMTLNLGLKQSLVAVVNEWADHNGVQPHPAIWVYPGGVHIGDPNADERTVANQLGCSVRELERL